ncbi:MAG: DUF2946 family protein [Alphaproteobacteria bacterium]|jgi:hypothetical protein
MMRPLRLILALVLCLQSGLAMAHCLRMAAPAGHQPFHVEICTVDGIVTLDLAEPGDGQGQHDGQQAGFCLVCHGLPHVALPAPTELPAPHVTLIVLPPLPLHASAPLGARAPPYEPTGPPTLS